MSNAGAALGAIEAYGSKDLQVIPERCVRVRNRHAACRKCLDVCPADVITCELNELAVDWAACLGCDACVAACPTEAFVSLKMDDAAILDACLSAKAAAEGPVCVVCRPLYERVLPHVDPEKAVAVDCLGRVDEALLAELAVAGASGVALVHGDCDACPCRTAGKRAAQVVAAASELAAAFGSGCRIALREKLPSVLRRAEEQAFDEGRRGFFASVKREMRQAADIAATAVANEVLAVQPGEADGEPDPFAGKVGEDGTLARLPLERHARLLRAVDALAASAPEPTAALTCGLFGRIAINADVCKSCRMCANFCPAGALRKFDFADGRMGVKHMPALCVACGCCEDICPADALKLHGTVAAKDVALRTSYAYVMKAPRVAYNRPDTMFRTVAPLFHTDQLYDMQH
ncbi:MAG: 4Fe-4S binding protein [Eggerthellaceae bacterium]|nr:4Fe-4S binding protein [Eggerthellaceae bacterium]